MPFDSEILVELINWEIGCSHSVVVSFLALLYFLIISTMTWLFDEQMELESISRGVEDNIRQIKCVDETLQEGNACAEDIELNVQKLGQIARVTKERAKHIRSKTVMQELQDVLDAEQELKPPTAALLSHSRRESLAEMVSSENFTKWLGFFWLSHFS